MASVDVGLPYSVMIRQLQAAGPVCSVWIPKCTGSGGPRGETFGDRAGGLGDDRESY